MWQSAGLASASLGTLGIVAPSGSVYGALTTPDPIALHVTLAQLAQEGVTHLALEASSHGIEQKRLDGVRLQAAAFSNLSRDHLDYHQTLEAYLAAKLRLFDVLLDRGSTAVVNIDDEASEQVVASCERRGIDVLDVGRSAKRLRIADTRPDGFATIVDLVYGGRTFTGRIPLAGEFQVSNVAVAAGLCIATGTEIEAVLASFEALEGAPGRLQLAGRRTFEGAPDAAVFIDYAHKPDALEKVLTTLRPMTSGKLSVVFGCGGDRDQGKRPIMGEIASRLADRVIVTDDNPRSEDAARIRSTILEGASGGRAELAEVADRSSAITAGVDALGPGDILVVAGKGHETGQIVGDEVLPFSDLDATHLALQNRRT
jgi:UDP-N-acetylmuramoyl-L-alanyl-D-glutamate--2,6-diaminopimelate ligase